MGYQYQWACPECGTRMAFANREQHETLGCDPVTVRKFQEARARAELAANDAVEELLAGWGEDATQGLDADRQDAHVTVTVTARRGFAKYLRDREL